MNALVEPIIPSPDGPAASPSSVRTWALQVAGLHCAACASTLEAVLTQVPGVNQARVGYAAALASVQVDEAAVQLSGLQAVAARAGFELDWARGVSAQGLRQREARQMLWRVFVAWFCMMQVMMLAAPTYFDSGAEVPADLAALMHGASWVLTLPVMLFSATPFLRGAWRSIRQRRMGMDVPVAVGIVLTFGISTVALVAPGGWIGSAVYLDSLTMFVAFLLGARWLEMRARHAAAATFEQAPDALPAEVSRLHQGQLERVRLDSIRVGDRLAIGAGDVIPADGRVLSGSTWVDESLLSGESRPVSKGQGQALSAGTVNLGQTFEMAVLACGDQTRHAQLNQLWQRALTERPAWAEEADRWAAPFLWGVLGLATIAAAVWATVDVTRALPVAAAVLVVTCPCALALAAPAAWVASARALAQRGLWCQRLGALERLAQVNRVVLDKTGTLTEPRAVPRVEPADGGAPDWVAQAVGLAQWSRHPLSQALARLPLTQPAGRWREVQEHAGEGLRGLDAAGRWWRLGRSAWVQPQADLGEAPLWFGAEAGGEAHPIDLDEVPRPSAVHALRRMMDLGLAVSLLSGDAAHRVQRLAAQLGLTGAAQGDCTPEIKRTQMQALQAQGAVVLMVGDGFNDAPALAQADVSVAMGQGVASARASADFTLATDDLAALPDLVLQGRRTRRVVRQNLVWAAAYNAVAVPLAMSGSLPPWAAGLGMALSSLWVVGNALRLGRL
ncbi:heavy metal translocating P-type ATPase [Inhella gelatinilytica]|uniref:Cation-translocating P-type ATPase n=1 Tax=Inhella gelatinilytica TaxID=2795030 RepID=A0A931IYS8_9BURK|nr:cation-translocating P-type ATPase [Inhella gelatinilytica]MBH9554096.1 cation-translocating P-type ATPase [Inhella gelatinilytica]